MRRLQFFGAVLLLALAALAAPTALGQDGDAPTVPDQATIEVDVFLKDSECEGTTFCIEFAKGVDEITLGPNARVTFHVHNIGGSDHDFAFTGASVEAANDEDVRPREDNGQDAAKTPLLAPGESYDLTVVLPESGSAGFICSVSGHASLGMEGTVRVGGGAAAEEETPIEEYGVDYWAYWVGVISFIILFVVLFVLYFVFRYGETPEAVDHRTGRTDKEVAAGSGVAHAQETGMWIALLVGVIFTLILIIAVILGGGNLSG